MPLDSTNWGEAGRLTVKIRTEIKIREVDRNWRKKAQEDSGRARACAGASFESVFVRIRSIWLPECVLADTRFVGTTLRLNAVLGLAVPRRQFIVRGKRATVNGKSRAAAAVVPAEHGASRQAVEIRLTLTTKGARRIIMVER